MELPRDLLYHATAAARLRPNTEIPAMRFTSSAAALAGLLVGIGLCPSAARAAEPYAAGVATIDITPTYPVRLSGFGFRRTESEGVTQRIWAKALAIDDGQPAVLITVDNCGVPAYLVREVAGRLEKKAGLARDRLGVTSTHTHTAPMLGGVLATLFSQPIPKEHQERIDRYTTELTDKLEQVALAALADRKPARLTWGIGKVGFAINRRTKGGPVDHDLPLLVVRDLEGRIRALYVCYACHCVTLSNNKISGDWAGYAQERIQDDHPGAIALVSIGCGADSNPISGVTGDKAEIASLQGAEIAAEVKRLLKGYLAPVTGKLAAASRKLELPLADLPARAEWEAKAKQQNAAGYHARVQLARLDRGEALRNRIEYTVQTWAFGDSLAMVFLPGEVVVDYGLRLKRELDGLRLWVNAYANDVPCYIPSERVLKEGRYEGGGAMIYYDVPVPFKPGLEQSIVSAVRAQLDARFAPRADPKGTGASRPLSPQQSLAAIQTKNDLTVELVAAEPLVTDPVAIDWGPDGRLWVAEMHDYPAGTRGDYRPGGRVRLLQATGNGGRYERATIFLDNIPFPTGVTAWGKGVLVCAAPDILYAEDTDSDGKADVVRKLFSGFGTENYQARVNSLEYGLDGWIHGSCGLYGGTIQNESGQRVVLGHRDFRIQPDAGRLEPATGHTQQGRPRDDWGNWFGCDNTHLCWHYPLADHYLRRNPHVVPPSALTNVSAEPDPNRLYPIRQVQMFRRSGQHGRTTAACGLGVYRDDLLGRQYTGNTFTCEPVNLVVHRLTLTPRDSTFVGHRAANEKASEFLASTDTWFRPVQARTGPDGCLWVVDMYRFVIEHPRWIPPEDLARLDVRAGHSLGRIYRIRPRDREPRPMPRLDRLDNAGLAAALDSPNGWQRDMAGQMLLGRADPAAVAALQRLAATSARPEARLHALCVLDGLGKLTPQVLLPALADEHAGVRRHAIRLAEPFLNTSAELGNALLKRVGDADAQVRLQLACSLGEWRAERAGWALAELVLPHVDDPYLSAAVLSSVHAGNLGAVIKGVLAGGADRSPPPELVQRLLTLALALDERRSLPQVLREVSTPRQGRFAVWQLAALAGVLEGAQRRGQSVESLADGPLLQQIKKMLARARTTAADDKTPLAERLAAVATLGREPDQAASDVALLGKLLGPHQPPALQAAALAVLGRIPEDAVAPFLIAGWNGYAPALKPQVLDLLLSRNAWLRQLLTGLEKGKVPAEHVDARRRQRLLAHRDEQVRARAARVFANTATSDRQKVVQSFEEVAALPGDIARGKTVFAKRCTACHRLQDVGHAVAPDLAALANKSAQFLLTEILDPNRNMDNRYVEYLAATRAGRTFTGVLASQTATSITLRGSEGKEEVILRGDLEELVSTGKSLMPEGLEKDVSKQDLADLIAYLADTRLPCKKFDGNTPTVVKPVAGRLALLATSAEIYGGEICFEPEHRNIGHWYGVQDHVLWNVRLDRPGRFDIYLDWACADAGAGNRFILEGAQPSIPGVVAGTGGWDRYQQKKIGTVTLAAGAHRIIFRPDGGVLSRALIDLRGVHFIPEGEQLKLR